MVWKMICCCDGCGVQKKEANGWLVNAIGQTIPTEHWTLQAASVPGAISVCEPACAHKMLDKSLEEGQRNI